jgi:hypothetical protein
MPNYIEILETLRTTSSTNEKIALVAANKDNPELREFLSLALTKLVTFGVARIPPEALKIDSEPMFPMSNAMAWLSIKDLLEKLSNRVLTGLAAQVAIHLLYADLTSLQRKWFECVLLKDLSSIGFGQTLFDKAYGTTTKFKIQLAEEQAEIENIDFETEGDLQLKGNGVRTTIIIENKKVAIIYGGRDGIEAENFYFLTEELELLAKDFVGQSYVLNGEVHVNHDPHDSMTLYSTDMTKTEANYLGKSGKVGSGWVKQQDKMNKALGFRSSAKFMIFDIISLDDWMRQSCPATQELRGATVQLMGNKAKELGLKHIESVPTERVSNTDEAIDKAQKYIDQGFEGAVFKPLNGLYEWKRSRAWIKIKKVCDFSIQLTKYEIQKDKYVKPAMVGAIFGVDKDGNEHKVGTGDKEVFSERIRQDMLENWDTGYKGKIYDCAAQQPSAKSTKYINPRLLIRREDRISLFD